MKRYKPLFESLLDELKLITSTTGKLNINTVFRTEKSHEAYKGKANYGKGKYFSLSQEEAIEYTLNPHATHFEKYDPKIHGKIDHYSLLRNTKVIVFNLDDDKDYDKLENLRKSIKPKDISEWALENKIDGVVIYTDEFNYGGNQIVIFQHAIGKVR